MLPSWNDLPSKVKNSILKNLSINDRFKFAQCSTRTSRDVLEFEKWRKVFFEKTNEHSTNVRGGYGFILKLTSVMSKEVSIQFNRIGEVCEIEWKWNEKTSQKELVEVKNVTKVAYVFFEALIPKVRNSLSTLHIRKIDIDFRENSVESFPQLKSLVIETRKENTLYWFLSKCPELKKLTVSFRKFNYSEIEQEETNSKNWRLDELIELKLDTNVESVTENIVSRTKILDTFKYTYYGEEVPKLNEDLVDILKKTSSKSLHIFSCLDDQQFTDLMGCYDSVKCGKGSINYDCLNRLIEEFMENCSNKQFMLHNVDVDILDSTCFKFQLIEPQFQFNIKHYSPVHRDERIRDNVDETITGDLRYFKDKKILTFRVQKQANKPTSWFDLPFEMKSEVLQYLSVEDRFKFAQCSISISKDVFAFERGDHMEFKKTENGYILNIGYECEKVSMKFEKVGNFCEIEWKWSEKAIRKEAIATKNLTKLAYEHFEELLQKFKNSLYSIRITKIDTEFEETSINCFPKLDYLHVMTSKKQTLYWLLSKSPNLQSLTISFHDFQFSKFEQKVENWNLEKLTELKLKTNVDSVTENVLSRVKHLEKFKYTFNGDNVLQANDILVRLLKNTSVEELNVFSRLNGSQFSDLVKLCRSVKCERNGISSMDIARTIDELLDTHGYKKFTIYKVSSSICEFSPLGLYPTLDEVCESFERRRRRRHYEYKEYEASFRRHHPPRDVIGNLTYCVRRCVLEFTLR